LIDKDPICCWSSTTSSRLRHGAIRCHLFVGPPSRPTTSPGH
jgi:hypothetical protein